MVQLHYQVINRTRLAGVEIMSLLLLLLITGYKIDKRIFSTVTMAEILSVKPPKGMI